MRIIVNEQETKDQILKESQYLAENMDTRQCPNLAILYQAPLLIEVDDKSTSEIYDELMEMREELEEYASWEGSELGEMTNALIHLSHYPDYITEDLLKCLYREMQYTLMMFKRDTEWVEREETITRKVKELEWKH